MSQHDTLHGVAKLSKTYSEDTLEDYQDTNITQISRECFIRKECQCNDVWGTLKSWDRLENKKYVGSATKITFFIWDRFFEKVVAT